MSKDGATLDPNNPGSHPDPLQRDDAEAKMKSAPIKSVSELPEDHPMRRRMEMLNFIEEQNAATGRMREDGTPEAVLPPVEDPDADPAEREAEVARKQLAASAAKTELEERGKPAISEFTDSGKKAPAAEIDAQKGDEKQVILDPATFGKNTLVKVTIDGKEELVLASKALGQYQKSGAADLRLAEATKLRRDAQGVLDTANKKAQETATTASPAAPAAAKIAEDATKRFKEASDALILGDTDTASKLFGEAVGIATATQSTGATFNEDALLGRVLERAIPQVKARLDSQGALDELFTNYPEIKAKKAYQFATDEYIGAYMSQGESEADAIRHAGETMAEEYNLGKRSEPEPQGRRLNSASPTTLAEKAAAKKALDNLPSGNARQAGPDEVVESPQDTIRAMQDARDPTLRRRAA